jgi:arginine repressor
MANFDYDYGFQWEGELPEEILSSIKKLSDNKDDKTQKELSVLLHKTFAGGTISTIWRMVEVVYIPGNFPDGTKGYQLVENKAMLTHQYNFPDSLVRFLDYVDVSDSFTVVFEDMDLPGDYSDYKEQAKSFTGFDEEEWETTAGNIAESYYNTDNEEVDDEDLTDDFEEDEDSEETVVFALCDDGKIYGINFVKGDISLHVFSGKASVINALLDTIRDQMIKN